MSVSDDQGFINKTHEIIKNIFPNLNKIHFDYLLDLLYNLVDNVVSIFNIDDITGFKVLLFDDDGRDIKGLFLLLLPYVDSRDIDENNKLNRVTSLNDLYVLKDYNGINETDISKFTPKYAFTNIQYNRCIRHLDGTIIERQFDITHTEHNYVLLLQTLKTVAHRLYVNWTNVVPLIDYKQTKLYLNTVTALRTQNITDQQLSLPSKDKMLFGTKHVRLLKMNHMYIGTIYDVIYHQLYRKMLKIRWLIYNVRIGYIKSSISLGKTSPTILDVLQDILGIDIKPMLDGKTWINIADTEDETKIKQEDFKTKWKKLITNDTSTKLSDDNKVSILRALTIYFEKYSTFITSDDAQNYKKLTPVIQKKREPLAEELLEEGLEEEKMEDDDTDDIDVDSLELYTKHFAEFNPEYIYDYMCGCLKLLKNSIYYKLLFGDVLDESHKIRIKLPTNAKYQPPPYEGSTIKFTIKNLFNFSKSLCCYDNSLIELPDRWVSLDEDRRKIFLDRLNNPPEIEQKIYNGEGWFWIGGNIRRVYPQVKYGNFIQTDRDYTEFVMQTNSFIYDTCMKNLIMLVFECLYMDGALSTFRTFTKKNIGNENIDAYKKCNYFLTQTPYDTLTTYDKDTGVVKYTDSLKRNSITDRKWYDAYAMNWVSQINFFHKYLNNRVMFVTGGTGVGKSTQLPKLLLYALKIIDCNDTGTVIDSQPRKRPTLDVSSRIAYEMGVPMTMKDDSAKEEKETENFYIQYKTHENSHVQNRLFTPVLKFVTDKILQNTISNAMYKKVSVQKRSDLDKEKCKEEEKKEKEKEKEKEKGKVMNKEKETEETDESNCDGDKITMSRKNMCDIVVVDESHEHNKNMDMILTLMKQVLYYNNDCKLVIVSATMADDEPSYRRFYRDINDNMMYPLNMHIKEKLIDRCNVDRRLDISVPGQTGNFPIRSIYFDDVPEKEAAKNRYIVTLVNKILLIPSTQDILIFKPGRKEIIACAKLINETTDDSVIAIPYFGDLSEQIRKFISDAPENKSKLAIRKIDIDSLDTIVSINQLHSDIVNYKHIIIVATNIAEASITINTLTDVIDDGQRKIARYSPQYGGVTLKKGNISEKSRIQRRGRVGRKMPGNAYFLYKKDALIHEVPEYDICISDITDIVFSMLRPEKSVVLFNESNDPNQIESRIFTPRVRALYKNLEGLDEIIVNQYYIRGCVKKIDKNSGKEKPYVQYVIYNYWGDPDQYDYGATVHNTKQYFNGYDVEQILDNECDFYIVHPSEMDIRRNIIGKVQRKTKNERYDLNIMLYLRKLIDLMVVVYKKINKHVIPDKMLQPVKKIIPLKQNILLTEEETKHAQIKEEKIKWKDINKKKEHDFVMFKSEYGEIINTLTHSIFLDANGIQYVIACCFASVYGCFDEMLKLLTILQYFTNKNMVPSKKVIIDDKPMYMPKCNSDLTLLLHIMNNILGKYNCFSQIKDILHELPLIEQSTVGSTIIKETIGSDKIDVDETYKVFLVKFNEYIENIENIENMSKTSSISYDCVTAYVRNAITLLYPKNDITQCTKFLNSNHVKYVSSGYTLEEKITASLLHAFGQNVVKSITGTELYMSIKYPTKICIKKIRSDIKKSTLSCVNKSYCTNYLLYIIITISEDDDEYVNSSISFLHYIDPKLLNIISYQYNIQSYANIVYRGIPTKNYGPNETQMSVVIPSDVARNYDQTLSKMLRGVFQNYDMTTVKYFDDIFENSKDDLQKQSRYNIDFISSNKLQQIDL